MDEAATISRDLALASARLQQAAQALGLIAKASEGRSTIANLANIFDKANYPALGEPSPGYRSADLAQTFRSVNDRLSDDEIVFWCQRMARNIRAEIAAINQRIAELRR